MQVRCVEERGPWGGYARGHSTLCILADRCSADGGRCVPGGVAQAECAQSCISLV